MTSKKFTFITCLVIVSVAIIFSFGIDMYGKYRIKEIHQDTQEKLQLEKQKQLNIIRGNHSLNITT